MWNKIVTWYKERKEKIIAEKAAKKAILEKYPFEFEKSMHYTAWMHWHNACNDVRYTDGTVDKCALRFIVLYREETPWAIFVCDNRKDKAKPFENYAAINYILVDSSEWNLFMDALHGIGIKYNKMVRWVTKYDNHAQPYQVKQTFGCIDPTISGAMGRSCAIN